MIHYAYILLLVFICNTENVEACHGNNVMSVCFNTAGAKGRQRTCKNSLFTNTRDVCKTAFYLRTCAKQLIIEDDVRCVCLKFGEKPKE